MKKSLWITITAVVILAGFLTWDYYAREARMKELAEQASKIYQAQVEHLNDDAAWGVKAE